MSRLDTGPARMVSAAWLAYRAKAPLKYTAFSLRTAVGWLGTAGAGVGEVDQAEAVAQSCIGDDV